MRRVHKRYQCDLPVTLNIGDREAAGKIANISLGGVFIETEEEVAYGTKLTVSFALPSLDDPMTVASTVRFAKPGGCGLQFGTLRAMETWALNELFKGLEVAE